MPEQTDKYKTIKKASKGLFKDKGSKFLAFSHNIISKEEAKDILESYKKKYHDARHHCFAYKIGIEQTEKKASDDNEPSNSAGPPILAQIEGHNLTNIIIVVVRYFGGTLLGVGGLISAYKNAAKTAIENSEIIEKTILKNFSIEFPYSENNRVLKLLNRFNAEIINKEYSQSCLIEVGISINMTNEFINSFNKYQNISIKHIE